MNAQRHTILKRTVGLLGIMQEAAAYAGVSVDELAQTLLGRRPVSETALNAANGLSDRFPNIADKLTGWPLVCSICHQDVEALSSTCPFCSKVGCTECVTGGGCPTCAAERALRVADLAAEEAERQRIVAMEELERIAVPPEKFVPFTATLPVHEETPS